MTLENHISLYDQDAKLAIMQSYDDYQNICFSLCHIALTGRAVGLLPGCSLLPVDLSSLLHETV